MITPQEYLGAKSDGRTVTIFTKDPSVHLALLGSSMKSSIEPGCSYVSFVTVRMEEDEPIGIVALRFSDHHGRWHHAFSYVTYANGLAKIDLTRNWMPQDQIVAGIDSDGSLRVLIGDKRYTTSQKDNSNGDIYVPGGKTLFCKYTIGLVSDQDIVDAAEKAVEEKNAIAEVAELRKKVEDTGKEIDRLNKEQDSLRKEVSLAWQSSAAVRKNKMIIADTLHKIVDSYGWNDWKPWGRKKRQEIRQMLADDANDKVIG